MAAGRGAYANDYDNKHENDEGDDGPLEPLLAIL